MEVFDTMEGCEVPNYSCQSRLIATDNEAMDWKLLRRHIAVDRDDENETGAARVPEAIYFGTNNI